MSGVEVAGLVLGAVPVLFEAVDSYRASFRRVKASINKRQRVAVLSRALRSQKQSLEAIVTTLLLESGCELLPPNGEEIAAFLNDNSLKNQVREFLGEENSVVFEDAVYECMNALHSTTIRVAMLVPSLKGQPSIQAIIEANQGSKRGQLDFLARFSMVFNDKDLLTDAENLDKSTASLDRFLTRITANRRLDDSTPSRAAAALAKSLRKVRQHAENLHDAVSHGWQHSCHHHQAKILLEERVTPSLKLQTRQQIFVNNSSSLFRIILASDEVLETGSWHDIAVEAPDHDCVNHTIQGQSAFSAPTRVRVTTPSAEPVKVPGDVIDNICLAMQRAKLSPYHSTFCLNSERKMCMSLSSKKLSIPCHINRSVSLDDLLKKPVLSTGSHTLRLPWQPRMLLALKLASSFLQFLRTPWLRSTWSATDVQFLTDSSGTQADLTEPFLAVEFDPSSPPKQQTNLNVQQELQELGILLLEIWHEVSLETKFNDQLDLIAKPNGRRSCALDWIDDVYNPLPPLYLEAVSRCVTRVTDTARTPTWDDNVLWKAVCENIIAPLKKNAQV